MSYRINEIFYSLQGEGFRAGSPNVFIRFAGCNLTCGFCDTEFESGTEMSAAEIAHKAKELMPEMTAVILTGGEPLLQYDQAFFNALRAEGVDMIACETNGSMPAKAHLDWIACAPKVAEHVVKQNFPDGVSELRYARHEGQALPCPAVSSIAKFLCPIYNGDQLDRKNLEHCIRLIKDHPGEGWRLSVQQHKAWRVR